MVYRSIQNRDFNQRDQPAVICNMQRAARLTPVLKLS